MGEGQSLRTGETDSGLAASHGKRVLLRGNFQARKAFKYDGRRMMVRKYASALAVFVVLLAVLPLAAQSPSQADLSAIHQIKEAGFGDSKVMEIMSYLTDVYGPRLTNSPNIKEAANWTTTKLKEWQLANVHREQWARSAAAGPMNVFPPR